MTYSKPEVNTLGQATEVIEKTGVKVPAHVGEPPIMRSIVNPAYDLDE